MRFCMKTWDAVQWNEKMQGLGRFLKKFKEVMIYKNIL